MAGVRSRSLDLLEAAIREHRGLITAAAEDVGITREALHHRIERSPRLQVAVHEARERQLDRAEAMLFQQIDAGEAWAVCFYLKTQGKSRGYIETHQIDITQAVRQAAIATGLDPDEAVRAAEAIITGK